MVPVKEEARSCKQDHAVTRKHSCLPVKEMPLSWLQDSDSYNSSTIIKKESQRWLPQRKDPYIETETPLE